MGSLHFCSRPRSHPTDKKKRLACSSERPNSLATGYQNPPLDTCTCCPTSPGDECVLVLVGFPLKSHEKGLEEPSPRARPKRPPVAVLSSQRLAPYCSQNSFAATPPRTRTPIKMGLYVSFSSPPPGLALSCPFLGVHAPDQKLLAETRTDTHPACVLRTRNYGPTLSETPTPTPCSLHEPEAGIVV